MCLLRFGQEIFFSFVKLREKSLNIFHIAQERFNTHLQKDYDRFHSSPRKDWDRDGGFSNFVFFGYSTRPTMDGKGL